MLDRIFCYYWYTDKTIVLDVYQAQVVAPHHQTYATTSSTPSLRNLMHSDPKLDGTRTTRLLLVVVLLGTFLSVFRGRRRENGHFKISQEEGLKKDNTSTTCATQNRNAGRCQNSPVVQTIVGGIIICSPGRPPYLSQLGFLGRWI